MGPIHEVVRAVNRVFLFALAKARRALMDFGAATILFVEKHPDTSSRGVFLTFPPRKSRSQIWMLAADSRLSLHAM